MSNDIEAAPALHEIDIGYLGRAQAIAAAVLPTSAGLAIVDPGPACALDGLARAMAAHGLQLSDTRWILLTHIHLDHASAAGVLAREYPQLRVCVHTRGAPHLADPSRLLASAQRIYGDRLAELFGEILPIPQDQLHVIEGGEILDLGDRRLRVEYAAGHAVHHVAWFDERTGTVFAGDTAGERFRPCDHVLPVTPPPDIDLDAWRRTLALLRGWRPEAIFLTHFGRFTDAARHLDEHEQRLEDWAERVRVSLTDARTDDERADAFAAEVERELRERVPAAHLPKYLSGGLRDSWFGLARYWRRRAPSP